MKKTAVLLLLALVTIPVFADDTAAAPSPIRNWVYLRSGSQTTTWAIYTRGLKGHGGLTLNVGVSPNFHNDYREYFAGVGVELNGKTAGVMPTLLYTQTSDRGGQLEYWVSPWVDKGKFVLQSFVGGYVPLHGQAWQVFFDPVTVAYKLNKRFAVGSTYTYTKGFGSQGYQALQGVGPAVQVTVPKGVLLVDALKGVGGGYKNEVRATLLLAF